MIKTKCAAALLATTLTIVTPVSAGAVEQTSSADVEALIPAIEAYVEEAMTAWQTPGLAIGIVADDALVYARGFGVREAGGEAAVDADTVFQIGSTSKAFLATAQAFMVDEGRIAWGDRVVDHDPDFALHDAWVTREFRIDDLLAQRSGLPDSVLSDLMIYGYSGEQVRQALRHIPPVTSFRSTYAYQNAFHLVSQKIVAKASGSVSWFEALKDRALVPLGMDSTSDSADAYLASGNRASGHRFEDGENIADPLGLFPYNAGGAGGLNSTVNDMGRWLRFHINHGEFDGRRLIGSDALAATYVPRVASDENQLTDDDVVNYANGWVIHAMPTGRLIDHGGATLNFTAYVAFDPDRRFGVVVLGNQRYSLLDRDAGLPARIGHYIVDRLQGRPERDRAGIALAEIRERERAAKAAEEDARKERPDIPSLPLEHYAGRYDNPVFGPIDITAGTDGRLQFSLGPQALPVTLEPWSGNIFVAQVPVASHAPGGRVPMISEMRVQFRLDSDGTVGGLEWTSLGLGGPPPFVRSGER